jgi:Fuc2NAc and GlcNAc transferase
LGLIDLPSGRSSHSRPIPKGGGLGIPLVSALSALFFFREMAGLAAFGLLFAAVALVNDRMDLPAGLRFFLGAALSLGCVWLYRPGMSPFPVLGTKTPGPVEGILFAVFLLAVANFFNFMDGINGIAGIEGVIALASLGAFAFASGRQDAGWFALAAAAATAGFLPHNFPAARVFMGDVGSIFIGFAGGGLILYLADGFREFLLLGLFLGVFILDSLFTLALRLARRENIFQAHRRHLYQRLVHRAGWSHARVTLIFAAVQASVNLLVLIFAGNFPMLFIVFWGGLIILYWSAHWGLSKTGKTGE